MTKLIKTDITGIGDPFILLHEGIHYHYSTGHPLGFEVRTSTDLVNWENRGLCYTDSKVGYMDFWAPEVIVRDGTFMMFFTSKNRTQDRLMLSVATSSSPLGPFVDVSDRPVFDFGYAAIDATVFIDDDGTPYMLYAKDCSENIVDGVHTSQIWGVRLNEDLLSVKDDPVLLLTPSGNVETKDPSWQWNEGPAVLKHDGRYYVSYSVNCYADPDYSVCYAVSDHILGPYVKAFENPILAKIPGVMSGPGHNMYFQSDKGQLMTAFHVHTDMDKPSGDRTTCFAPVRFDNDGKLIIETT